MRFKFKKKKTQAADSANTPAETAQLMRMGLMAVLLGDASGLPQFRDVFEPQGIMYQEGEDIVSYCARGYSMEREAFIVYAKAIIAGGTVRDGVEAALRFRLAQQTAREGLSPPAPPTIQ